MRLPILVAQFGAAVLVLTAPLSVSAQPKAEVALPEMVSAIGVASTEVPPDTAVLTFGVEIQNANTSQAVLTNERMTRKIVAALEARGVEAADIAVAPYTMVLVPNTFIPALGTNQKVEFDIQQRGAYKVTTDIRVTVRRLPELSTLINAALDAGVDRIDTVEYSISKRSKVEESLIPKAIAAAGAQAKVLADNTGLTLVDPVHISVIPEPDPPSVSVAGGELRSGNLNLPMLTVKLSVRVEYRAKKAN